MEVKDNEVKKAFKEPVAETTESPAPKLQKISEMILNEICWKVLKTSAE